jgi:hypothetical protein
VCFRCWARARRWPAATGDADDPFVVAYRAQGGSMRTGAFDATKSYVLRPLGERQEIRDHYVQAALDVFLKGASESERFAGTILPSSMRTTVPSESSLAA